MCARVGIGRGVTVLAWTAHVDSASALTLPPLAPGDYAWVDLKNAVKEQGVVVVEAVNVSEPSSFKGRVRVRFIADNSIAHILPAKLHRRLVSRAGREEPLIVVVEETDDFRRLCRTQVGPGDTVVELGCSYGLATAILFSSMSCDQLSATVSKSTRLIAVDISSECINRARQHVRAEEKRLLDNEVFSRCCPVEFIQSAVGAEALESALPTVVSAFFVDVGGNRPLAAVVDVLHGLLQSQQQPPPFIVIKSRSLFYAAQQSINPSSIAEAAHSKRLAVRHEGNRLFLKHFKGGLAPASFWSSLKRCEDAAVEPQGSEKKDHLDCDNHESQQRRFGVFLVTVAALSMLFLTLHKRNAIPSHNRTWSH